MTKEDVYGMIAKRAEALPHLWGENFLNGILNKRIGQYIMKRSYNISDVARFVTEFPIEIDGTMPWANAQVTAGGINTSEFRPDTMESKKMSGLYAAGEVLDIDGDCGGYNLQWAWSSGITAGNSAAEAVDYD